ncbi:MAG: UDP-3-O-(3-hydroxymyristoyl)glucosamine N-acyltransferase [Syntrophales bacterium]|nr:UDP-3-O-(3-hydroxymyristoyl)glucosamine N-acyltransferase [Syntrophales bacterium]
MSKTVKEIAVLVNGDVVGDGDIRIERIRSIEEAKTGDLTFVANPKYREWLASTEASAVLVPPGTEAAGKTLIIVADPYLHLGKLLAEFYPEEVCTPGIAEDTFISAEAEVSPGVTVFPCVTVDRGAKIGRNVVLYPGVYIGRHVTIGEGTTIYPNVTIYRRTQIGCRVIIHAGVVIGSDGFGFARPGVGNEKIPQVGYVQIDDDVEIGANTTIDRGTLGKTWIQRGTKIDNLVQIAHNVVIGENSVIVSQTGISGSTKLGKGVITGGQAGLVGHINLGDHVMVGAQSGVHEDVPANQVVSGSPHMPHRHWLRVMASLIRLPDMRKTIQDMQKKIEELEKRYD